MIELRSDTFTVADEKMRRAMAQAQVGDDVYNEDPTVNNLQKIAGEFFGKESAIFVPSGTMGNLLAVLTACQRGDEIIAEYNSHIFQYEVAGVSALAGVQINPIKGIDGKIPIDYLNGAIRDENIHFPTTRMICLENTHNMSGGKVLEVEYINAVAGIAKKNNIHLHIDGARIFNAAVAQGIDPKKLLENVDSVMVCLSKGLGAPMGSLLVGTEEFINSVRKYRKMLGGGMRQWGHAAAAALIALEDGPKRLHEDHENCKALAEALKEKKWTEDVQQSTNICRFFVPDNKQADNFQEYMLKNGVRVQKAGNSFRMVTHLNVSQEDTKKVVELINNF